jgi:hypothetical protein
MKQTFHENKNSPILRMYEFSSNHIFVKNEGHIGALHIK